MDAEALAQKYVGNYVSDYEQERSSCPRWPVEQATVGRLLSQLAPGSTVLDIPVGTGRFAPFYSQYQLRVTGADTSADMLAEAQRKSTALRLDMTLVSADIRKLVWPDRHFDAVVCIRMFQWFRAPEFHAALSELARVSRGPVIFCAPTYLPLRAVRNLDDVVRYLLQWKLRFYKWRTHSDLQCHELRSFDEALAKAGLEVTAAYPLPCRRHAYAIYVTRRRTT